MSEWIVKVPTELKQLRPTDEVDPGFNKVARVWPNSPEDVCLQVRALRGRTRTFATAWLRQDEVRELRDFLSKVLVRHFGEEER